MERSEFQRCGYTVRELEDRYGHNPTDECQFCAKNNISCLVLNHGATPEGVDQRRASQGKFILI